MFFPLIAGGLHVHQSQRAIMTSSFLNGPSLLRLLRGQVFPRMADDDIFIQGNSENTLETISLSSRKSFTLVELWVGCSLHESGATRADEVAH